MTTWAATGHRPNKLGGYSPEVSSKLLRLANIFIASHNPSKIISGMALGWDQEIAYAAIKAGVPVIAAIPFKGQESIWPQHSKDRYNAILKNCSEVVCVSYGVYSPLKMQVRNEWMVDHCDALVALYDGSPSGGTSNCVNYARMSDTTIVNLWDGWMALG